VIEKPNANELSGLRSHSKRNQSPFSASCTFEKLPPAAGQVQILSFSIFFADLKGKVERPRWLALLRELLNLYP
jgi:hypothetical protein